MPASKTNSRELLIIGSVMADIVCYVSKLPQSGEGIVVQNSAISLGGCAFNAANIIRQLGQSCYLFAPIGQGMYASFIRSELAKRGQAALHIDSEQDCGACICMVEPGGERTLLTLPGIDRDYCTEWFDNFDTSSFTSALICGYEIEGQGGDAIIGFLEQHPDMELVYAPGPRICGVGAKKTGRINALSPLWHLNDLEACNYTGADTLEKAGQIIQAQCKNAVVITEGAKGAHLFTGREHLFVPTQAIEPVDTIGAGDAHIGALMAARNAGQDWQSALMIANQLAGEICGISGATFTDQAFERLRI